DCHVTGVQTCALPIYVFKVNDQVCVWRSVQKGLEPAAYRIVEVLNRLRAIGVEQSIAKVRKLVAPGGSGVKLHLLTGMPHGVERSDERPCRDRDRSGG